MHYHTERTDALAATIRQEVNSARREHGQAPVKHVDALDAIAADYATTLRYNTDYGHRLDGSPGDRAPRFVDVRENLHRRSAEHVAVDATAAATVTAWLESPGHRKNLLSKQMRVAGLGVAASTDTIYVVQVLAAGESVAASLRDAAAKLNPF
jgi:uncharacterized protein YkwD